MDNKDIQNSGSFNDPVNWKSLGFFSADDYLIYIFKKTEKITSALYLVSGLLKDDEPLKWELRDRGMDLLSSSFTASSSLPGDKNVVIQSLFTAALETMSLLNVAKISNLISPMNHMILVREIDQVLTLMRDRLAQNAENAGYILSESFFKTPDLFSSGFKSDLGTGSSRQTGRADGGHDLYKGQSSQGQYSGASIMRSNQRHGNSQNSQLKKTHRQQMILDVLKGQSGLTIKDFSKVIKDCSEKTIQRELLELVEKGVVKKEGERRWSRYSLK
jgi:hypothetical protein